MNIEHGGNDNEDNNMSGDIARELLDVGEMLKDIEQLLPAAKDDIGLIEANIERVREQLQIYDHRAEEMRLEGKLTEEMEISRSIGKVMNNIEDGLKRLVEDRDMAINTRMTVENAIVHLRETQEELLEKFPDSQKQ